MRLPSLPPLIPTTDADPCFTDETPGPVTRKGVDQGYTAGRTQRSRPSALSALPLPGAGLLANPPLVQDVSLVSVMYREIQGGGRQRDTPIVAEDLKKDSSPECTEESCRWRPVGRTVQVKRVT